MRTPFLLPALTLTLAAQAPLAERVQAASRLRAEDLLQLQAELVQETHAGKGYFEALVAYGLVAQTREKDPKGAEALLDRTLTALKPQRDPESLALQGALLGLKLGFRPGEAMTLAPRAQGMFGEARAKAPASPRVLLFHGLHILHTPEFFGGGAKAALPLLQGAVKAAEAEAAPADPWAPSWGKAEAYAWLALAETGLGQHQEAKIHVGKALALDPTYGFARWVVAPRVIEAPAKEGK